MKRKTLITREMRGLLGVAAAPQSFDIEKGHIRRFAQAVGDANPLWNDREYACKSRHGAIVAPPAFIIDIALKKLADRLMEMLGPAGGFINAATEIEYYRPILEGDTITATATLVDLEEKAGRTGTLLFMPVEVIFRNQRGETVRKCRNTFVGTEL